MDPITLIALGSLAVTAVGSFFGMSGTSDAAKAQQQQVALEEKIQKQQEEQMALVAQRLKLQEVRNAQIATSEARSRSVTQGAQAGSVVPGAMGQISGQESTNIVGLQENYTIGRNMYGLTYQLDQAKIAEANAKSTMALGQGLTSLGGAMSANLGTINTAIYGMGQGAPYNPFYGYGSGDAMYQGPVPQTNNPYTWYGM
jgi:hypothetical protein